MQPYNAEATNIGIWVPAANAGEVLPSEFYIEVERPEDGVIELQYRHIDFPITDSAELAAAMGTINELYTRSITGSDVRKHGSEG